MISYLEQLLDHYNALELAANPPHPGAYIPTRAEQAEALMEEVGKEIAEIERQDAPVFEMVELKEKLYDDDSGRCYYCREDTLWGDAPHDAYCPAYQLARLKNTLVWVGFEPFTQEDRDFEITKVLEIEKRLYKLLRGIV